MKFNPLTKDIYTDNDEFVKRMHCPFQMNWDDLEHSRKAKPLCVNCNRFIIDTQELADDELLTIIKQNPEACLKVDLNQENLKIVTDGFIIQK